MKRFCGRFAATEKFRLLVLAAVACAVMLPALAGGLPSGADLAHHYQCAATFAESIRGGDLYPSWSAARNFGYGGMETRLYPPLSHYALALAYLAVGDWHAASWLVFFLLTFAASLGVYLWARETLAPAPAVFAGVVYALVPYHLNQLYNTFFYAEFAGAAVLPFVFLFVSRVCRRGRAGDVAALAAAGALLVLTHLPLTVIGAVAVALYAATLLERAKIGAQLLKLAAAGAAALAASAFFWTKVLLEREWMAKTSVYPEPVFDYRLNFLLTSLQTYEGVGQMVYENSTVYYDKMLLFVALAALVATVPVFVAERRFDWRNAGVWLVFAAAVFFAVPASRPVWDHFALLREVQFPWRFLTVAGLAGAVLVASQSERIAAWFGGKKRPLALVAAGCLLVMVAYTLGQVVRPALYVERAAVPAFIAENERAVGLEFWWPIWAREGFARGRAPVEADGRAAQIEKWTATEKEFELGAGEAGPARVAVFYHPHWRAFVGGAPAATEPDEKGALVVRVPAEAARVALRFEEPPLVRAAGFVSPAAWLLLAALAVFLGARRRRPAGG